MGKNKLKKKKGKKKTEKNNSNSEFNIINQLKEKNLIADIITICPIVIALFNFYYQFIIVSKFTFYNFNSAFMFENDCIFQLIKLIFGFFTGLLIYIIVVQKMNEKGIKKKILNFSAKLILIIILIFPSIILSGKISIIVSILIVIAIKVSYDFLNKQIPIKESLKKFYQKQKRLFTILVYIVVTFCIIYGVVTIVEFCSLFLKKEFLITTYQNQQYFVVYQTENYSYAFPIEEKIENNKKVLIINNTSLTKITEECMNFENKYYEKYTMIKKINLFSL